MQLQSVAWPQLDNSGKKISSQQYLERERRGGGRELVLVGEGQGLRKGK